jgi:hypothetical protein
MFRRPEAVSEEALFALRQGLEQLPVPAPSANFEARVHSELAVPQAGLLANLWISVRPALAPAAISLIITLALLQGISYNSVDSPSGRSDRVTVAYGAPAQAQEFLTALGP